MAHAALSPSSAHRWLRCPASVPLEAGQPDTAGEYAAEGTAAHELAALALTTGNEASAFLDRVIRVEGKPFDVAEDMAEHVQTYLDYVRALGGELMVEQRLDISALTGEGGAAGTADAVVLADDELIIVDLKYGRGVKVEAEENDQLSIYALAAYDAFGLLGSFERLRLVIVQPRLGSISEWTIPVSSIDEIRARVAKGADRCRAAGAYHEKYSGELHEKYFSPSDKACRFCKAKAVCPALAKHVLGTVADDFVDMTRPVAPQIDRVAERTFDNATLGNLLAAIDLIEGWCKAVRGKAEAELLAGHAVPGWKLVEGRWGSRKWSNDAQVEEMLRAMRLRTEQMYDLSLISPTTAEKLHKAGDIGPRQWPKVQALITQANGKPSVAPESDKRPALVVEAQVDDFADLTGAEGLV